MSQEDVLHAPDNSGTTSGMSKDKGSYKGMLGEDTLMDNSKDGYGPWVMVSRKRNGSKVTKKMDPTDQRTL